jgi:phage terminase Nu1 subunit (DNA packaging protein)
MVQVVPDGVTPFEDRRGHNVRRVPGDLLTTAELARLLKVSPRTVQLWRRQGLITPELVTPGGLSRWIESDVRAQLRKLDEERRRAEEER